jgi:hypothetical protein
MGMLERIKSKQTIKKLPENIYYHLLFHSWVDFDMRATGNMETYFDYLESMKFLYKNLAEYEYDESVKLVDYKNFLGVYFKCSRILDLESLRTMRGDNYKWKKMYRGWTVSAIDE